MLRLRFQTNTSEEERRTFPLRQHVRHSRMLTGFRHVKRVDFYNANMSISLYTRLDWRSIARHNSTQTECALCHTLTVNNVHLDVGLMGASCRCVGICLCECITFLIICFELFRGKCSGIRGSLLHPWLKGTNCLYRIWSNAVIVNGFVFAYTQN